MNRLSDMLLAFTAAAAAPPVRTSVTFDYGWSFALGDPAGAEPPLSTASTISKSASSTVAAITLVVKAQVSPEK